MSLLCMVHQKELRKNVPWLLRWWTFREWHTRSVTYTFIPKSHCREFLEPRHSNKQIYQKSFESKNCSQIFIALSDNQHHLESKYHCEKLYYCHGEQYTKLLWFLLNYWCRYSNGFELGSWTNTFSKRRKWFLQMVKRPNLLCWYNKNKYP